MTARLTEVKVDPFDVRVAVGASGKLAAFNVAGVLSTADVHVAMLIGRLCDETDEDVLLAAALAVRVPRLAHSCADGSVSNHETARARGTSARFTVTGRCEWR